MTEKVLSYPRGPVGDYDGVSQTRPWDCGPASAQIILQAAGITKTEQWLIDRIGTTVNGTNSADCIIPTLNTLLPQSKFRSVWLSREPVTQAQIDQLWADATRSINGNGIGIILNFEAPPGRGPRTSRGSTPPPYPLHSTTYHYTAGMGTAVDPDGSRHIWVADPANFGGVSGYWCRVEEIARLIVPHAYAYSSATPAVAVPPPAPVVVIPTDSMARTDIEWRATQFGDQAAIAVLVKAAQVDDRGKAALALLERTNPAALQSFINRKAAA